MSRHSGHRLRAPFSGLSSKGLDTTLPCGDASNVDARKPFGLALYCPKQTRLLWLCTRNREHRAHWGHLTPQARRAATSALVEGTRPENHAGGPVPLYPLEPRLSRVDCAKHICDNRAKYPKLLDAGCFQTANYSGLWQNVCGRSHTASRQLRGMIA